MCRELSLWWTKGSRDDVFWRTSQSGGRATTRMKKGKSTFGQQGDIAAVDPIGLPLVQLVTIEAKKGYNRETAHNLLDQDGPSVWKKFIEQAKAAARCARTPFWMLVHKRDRRETVVAIPFDLYDRLALAHAVPNAIMVLRDFGKIFVTTLDQFKQHVKPKDIMDLVRCVPRPKPTIRVRRIA